MTIPYHILKQYKDRFGQDLEVLEHEGGSTWNDGGFWYSTIVKMNGGIFRIYMHSDYQPDKLEVLKLKAVPTVKYVPA